MFGICITNIFNTGTQRPENISLYCLREEITSQLGAI